MVPASPPPSRSTESSPWGPLLFAGIFLALTALIFTLAIKPAPQAAPSLSPKSEAAVSAIASPNLMPKLPLTYPPSRTTNASDTYFGTRVEDPYRWLEDGKSPEVQGWLASQNHLARTYLDALPGRAALQKRYAQLLHIETISSPGRSGDRFFYMKRRVNDEKSILYWRQVGDTDPTEHVLLDPNLYIGRNNAALGDAVPTLDGKLLAYTLRPDAADEATLYVRDVASGRDLPGEVIDGAKYAGPSWLPDGSGFVYTYLPPAEGGKTAERPGLAVVRFHKLGTDPKLDPILHGKTGDPTKFINADVSRDGKWIFFVQQNGWDKNDLYYQPLHGAPTVDLARHWKPLAVGKPYLYSLTPWEGQAYILTNEGAPHFRLFKVALSHPDRAAWREIIPASPDRVLQDVSIVGGRLVVESLANVTSHLEIRDLEGRNPVEVPLPGLGTVSELTGEPDHDDLYFGFINFTTPPEIFQTTVSHPEAQKLWARVKIAVDPSPYVVEQQFFSSRDGTHVPMFIVHRRDMPFDGSTPFVMYGYGGFGLSETPFFSPGFYPWLEAGGGYALVNLRGGGEFGEQWHQDGMLLKKQHVFDDMIAGAEFLRDRGYTKPERLAVRGGSNGGLLVGAMVTQRPDLFRAAVCEVPLLDMIRYPLFGSGSTWIPEYGSPKDAAQFRALLAYSPYHQVKKGAAYPSILICTAQNDDRVDPMHARKMAAALQAATSSPNPILLRLETSSGHGGSDQVQKTVVYATDLWGFLIHELGAKTLVDGH